MEKVRLTKGELINIFNNNKYILIKSGNSGKFYGVNCKVINSKNNQKHINGRLKDESIYESYKPCNINEYITYKMPFLKSN